MKCPTCPNATLVTSDRQGVEIDYCPDCRGVWLDRGEIDKLIGRSAPSPGRRTDEGGHGASYHYDDARHRVRRKRSWLEDIFD